MEANSRAQAQPEPDDLVPALPVGLYAAELAAMVDRPFCFSERHKDQAGRADRTLCQPGILEFERKLIRRAHKLGVPLFAHCINRGAQEQNRLYVQGRSRAKAGESPHNYGAAADIVHGTKGWDLTRKQWELIGHLGQEVAAAAGIKITWGGDWKFYDPAHWELTEWRQLRDLYKSGGDWHVR